MAAPALNLSRLKQDLKQGGFDNQKQTEGITSAGARIIGRIKQKTRAAYSCSAGLHILAERTGLEPATSDVTGRHSNQLNYHSEKYTVLLTPVFQPVSRPENRGTRKRRQMFPVIVTSPKSVSLQHPSKLYQL